MRYVYAVILVLILVWIICGWLHTRDSVTITEKEPPE